VEPRARKKIAQTSACCSSALRDKVRLPFSNRPPRKIQIETSRLQFELKKFSLMSALQLDIFESVSKLSITHSFIVKYVDLRE